MMRWRSGAAPRDQGATAIIAAIVLVVLLGFAALVVDVGHLFQVRGELQNGADAAALAGAQRLDCTPSGIANAEQAARDFAQRHWADFNPLASAYDPEDLKVEIGRWFFAGAANTDPCGCAAPCFCPIDNPQSTSRVINAVRVTAFRSEVDPAGENNPSRPVGHSFAFFIGKTRTDVLAQAVAVGAGPGQECAFPMVVFDCTVDETLGDDQGNCDYCMQFASANEDNAGWTGFDLSAAPVKIDDLIRAACMDPVTGQVLVDSETLECQGTCQTVSAGDGINVTNGNNMSTSHICPAIQEILKRGDPDADAQPFSVRVPVLLSDPGQPCDETQFSNSHPTVAGFAKMTIYGARCGSADKTGGVYYDIKPECVEGDWPPSSDKWVIAALECGLQDNESPGGGCFGVDTNRSRLVQ